MSSESSRPWHREPMVWLVIAIPATAVVVGLLMLTLSIRHYDGLVSDDYYKEGLGINESIERNQNALQKEINALIFLDQAGGLISVSLQGNVYFEAPVSVEVNLRHSTRAGFDRNLVLPLAMDNRYSGALPELVEGKWYLEIESGDWKIAGQMRIPLNQNEFQVFAQ